MRSNENITSFIQILLNTKRAAYFQQFRVILFHIVVLVLRLDHVTGLY